MAFSHKSGNGDAATPYLTEKDLLRQIASNYTKEQLVSKNKLNETAAHNAKDLMQANLQKCHKVWTVFTKFIRSQVMDKSRTVDTVVMGLFTNNAVAGVNYMPAPDFLEAGKFKLQRGMATQLAGSEITDVSKANQLYGQGYNQFLNVSLSLDL